MTTNHTNLTDADVLKNLNNRYNLLSEMVRGVCEGQFTGLIVSGERGISKSHTVHNILDRYDPKVPGNEEMPEEQRRSIKRFTGKITPLQLFLNLQQNADKKSILIFDDCDSAWNDIGALNCLKAAMDTKPTRTVTWASSSRMVRDESFVFEGSVIVVTNAHMASEHYRAFLDRVQKFPVYMTPREKILKIKEIAQNDDTYDRDLATQVANFIEECEPMIGNYLSIRTFVNTYALAKYSPMWQELAKISVFSQQV